MKLDTSYRNFKKNDIVFHSPVGNCTRIEKLIKGKIIEISPKGDMAFFKIKLLENYGNFKKNYVSKIGYGHNWRSFKLLKFIKKGSGDMNEIIINLFPKTKDAVLVDKWFGDEIEESLLFKLLLVGKEKEILSEAERLEVESKK